MTPSAYQEAILHAVTTTPDNLIIQACAGSGKTTTLRLISQALPRNQRILAVCFNKSIAQEFQQKLPPHVEARTLHSVGYRIVMKAQPGAQLEERKSRKVIEAYVRMEGPAGVARQHMVKRFLGAAVSLVQATMTDPNDAAALIDLADEYSLAWYPGAEKDIAEVLRLLRNQKMIVSFDDMLDHPLAHGYEIPTYDVVMVDEAQDLNLQQIEFVSRLAEGGRIIAVGDRWQSIYGFRGADHRAMDRIKERFNCTELPLSVCYRCARTVVGSAQEVVGLDMIQAHDTAEDGLVVYSGVECYEPTLDWLEGGDMVICRCNAPLAAPCFRLIQKGKKAIVKGADIGKGLLVLIDDLVSLKAPKSVEDLLRVLRAWEWERVSKLLAEDRVKAAEKVQDQVETISVLAQDADTIEAIRGRIQTIFDDTLAGVVFSSIHRAKGLEADRVVILAPHLLPHPMVLKHGKAADFQQEQNLAYVARTRAKHTLVFQEVPA